MPPKPKYTKEEIVAAALGIVSKNGLSALTAKELGKALNTSARRFSPCSTPCRRFRTR